MPEARIPNLTVLSHPLLAHKLTLLRDRRTGTRDFRHLLREISMLLAYEATKDLPTDPVEIDTPLERTAGHVVSETTLTLVPVLRAGLGMVEGIRDIMPTARVGMIGIKRHETTLQPEGYYFKIPDSAHARTFLVLDPMLATGGTAAAAARALKDAGARRIRLLCIVAAPAGVLKMNEMHPDVPIIATALDRELDERGFILPGLGDAGDRLFGTG